MAKSWPSVLPLPQGRCRADTLGVAGWDLDGVGQYLSEMVIFVGFNSIDGDFHVQRSDSHGIQRDSTVNLMGSNGISE